MGCFKIKYLENNSPQLSNLNERQSYIDIKVINSSKVSTQRDTVIESINTNDETHDDIVGETAIKIGYDSKWNSECCTGDEVREENNHSIKRDRDELFCETDSKRSKLFEDINNA